MCFSTDRKDPKHLMIKLKVSWDYISVIMYYSN